MGLRGMVSVPVIQFGPTRLMAGKRLGYASRESIKHGAIYGKF
jgi:hypothetical protein